MQLYDGWPESGVSGALQLLGLNVKGQVRNNIDSTK